MKCAIKFKDLSKYADGACGLREKEIIQARLEECAECRQILSNLNLLKQSLAQLPTVKESSDFDFVFQQKLKERLQEKVSVSLNEILQKAMSGIRDAFIPNIPVLVKVTALFILVASLLFGSYSYYTYTKLPMIETISGIVQIYRPGAEGYVIARANMRLKEGYRIKTAQDAVVNIVSRDKYAARIKEDSDIAIAKLDVLKVNHYTEFDIAAGKLMVNTTKGFKGSSMSLKTPACKAKVVGTAFAINVDRKAKGATWLGVLEGRVDVSSQGEDVYVNAGQKTEVRPGSIPDAPTLLSDNEWNQIQELYQLGERPQVVLLISMRANRVQELLRPAPLYISDTEPRTIPKDLEMIIRIINRAIENNDMETHSYAIESLEQLINKYPNPKYNPQFIMFIGSYYYYIGNYQKAVYTFEKVVNEYPDYILSSLAQCAIATIYQNNIKDTEKAQAAYQALLDKYPDSPDAIKAREFFKKIME